MGRYVSTVATQKSMPSLPVSPGPSRLILIKTFATDSDLSLARAR